MTRTAPPPGASDGVETREGDVWRLVGKNASVRMLVLPVSAVLGIIVTRLIIDNFGRAAYAQYALLVGIGALLPFADLGISAAIMNAVASSDAPDRDPHVRRVLTTAIRILFVSMTVLLLITIGISVSGWWDELLGKGLIPGGGSTAATLCLAMIAVTLTVGFGQRILAGLGQNHVSIALLGLQTPVVLIALLLIVHFNIRGSSYVAVIPYVVTFGISIVATYLASRKIRPAVGRAVRDAPRFRTHRGGKVFDVAWPMLIQMIALPIAMQTDRLLLSHVSSPDQLGKYSLASQMFTPVWQVANSAGIALWPVFARARARKSTTAGSPITLSMGFAGAAAVCCLNLAVLSPWLASLASGGEIKLSLGLVVTFSIFMIIQAAKYPLGMYMTDARGLRYQAFMILLLLPINLGLSWVLAVHYGAVGPVIGSTISVFLCQFVANWIYVKRDLRVRAPTGR